VIESSYAGDVEANVKYARAAMLHSLRRGEAPFASHLLYTQCLDDTIPAERELGITAGFAWANGLARAFYVDLGWSPGMLRALELCEKQGIPYETRNVPLIDLPDLRSDPKPPIMCKANGYAIQYDPAKRDKVTIRLQGLTPFGAVYVDQDLEPILEMIKGIR